jgi:flagellum-specific peptidoglycan hydrolase FlgJ
MIESVASSAVGLSYGSGSSLRFASQTAESKGSGSRSTASAAAQVKVLTPEQQRQVQQLKETDRKVRAHEQAHLSVGADLVRGGATFTYQTGPDDQRYAVSGEVSIDASPGRTPAETIPKAQHIRATALAPADPSAQDQSVATEASRMESDARVELMAQQHEKTGQTASAASKPSEQSGARFYQAIAHSGENGAVVGGGLSSFA